MVNGQLADMPTRGLVIPRTGHLADWTSRRLDLLSDFILAHLICYYPPFMALNSL